MQHRGLARLQTHHCRLGGMRVPGGFSVIYPMCAAPLASPAPAESALWRADKADVRKHGCKLLPHVRKHLQRLCAQHVLARKRTRRLPAALRMQNSALLPRKNSTNFKSFAHSKRGSNCPGRCAWKGHAIVHLSGQAHLHLL